MTVKEFVRWLVCWDGGNPLQCFKRPWLRNVWMIGCKSIGVGRGIAICTSEITRVAALSLSLSSLIWFSSANRQSLRLWLPLVIMSAAHDKYIVCSLKYSNPRYRWGCGYSNHVGGARAVQGRCIRFISLTSVLLAAIRNKRNARKIFILVPRSCSYWKMSNLTLKYVVRRVNAAPPTIRITAESWKPIAMTFTSGRESGCADWTAPTN